LQPAVGVEDRVAGDLRPVALPLLAGDDLFALQRAAAIQLGMQLGNALRIQLRRQQFDRVAPRTSSSRQPKVRAKPALV
jgi:hypothetical protein